MSEQDINAQIEKWHATKTNVAMSLGSFGAVSLAMHSTGGIILGTVAAMVAARHGDDMANVVRNAASQVDAIVKSLHQSKEAQPKDGRDDPQTEKLPGLQQEHTQPVCSQYLNLGEVFKPHINQVLSNRIAILGMPNAGKTNTVSVLCEELGKRGVPLIVFDTKPEYAKLCAKPYFTNPYKASAKNVKHNAFEFGQQIMRECLQVVLDLTSYGDSDVAALVMIGIINGIWAWEYALPNDKRVPVMIVLDEAHQWLPQQQNLTDVSKSKDEETGVSLFTQLQKAFFKVINLGRSYGIGIVVSTQRPQNIDKRAINPHEWKILLKANAPNDLKVYEEYGVAGEVAQKLHMGQAYIIGPGEYCNGEVYQIRKRKSPDDSKTPGFENLRKKEEAKPAISLPSEPIMVTPERFPDWFENGQLIPSPYYEQTIHRPYYTKMPVNPNLQREAQIYEDTGYKQPLNAPVNGSTSLSDRQQTPVNLETVNEPVNANLSVKNGSDALPGVNVNLDTSMISAEKRETIRRAVDMGVLTHAQIAKMVKLDGRNYHIYKQVCAEEGIEIK